MASPPQPTTTSETLTAIAKTYISIFTTLDASIFKSIHSDSFTHTFAPASLKMPTALDAAQFASHLTKMRGVMSGFPVRAKQIWPNPSLGQVVIWADSETQFHEHVKDTDPGGPDEWTYRGEYMFVLTTDQSGEKIAHVLEFLDSKATEQAQALIARAWKNKEQAERSLKK